MNNEPVKLEKSRSKVDISRASGEYNLEVLPNNYAGFKKIEITAQSLSGYTPTYQSSASLELKEKKTNEVRFKRDTSLSNKKTIPMETSKAGNGSASSSRNLPSLSNKIDRSVHKNSMSQVLIHNYGADEQEKR